MRDNALLMGESLHDSSSLMSGTQGEKAHIAYKEDKTAIDGCVVDY